MQNLTIKEEALLKQAIERRNTEGCSTDEELRVLLKHYTQLEQLLKFHGEVYRLVWFDVFQKLDQFKSFYTARNRDKKLNYTITGELI